MANWTETGFLRAAIIANGGTCDDLPDNLESTLYKRLIEVCANGGGGGGGLPAGGAPFQQLVTDGEGNTVWADRLAYEDPDMMTALLPQTTLLPMDEDGDGLNDTFALIIPPSAPLSEGETYIVTYNGEVFECKAKNYEGAIGLGNMAPLADAEDTGEPFAFVVLPEELVAEINSGVYGVALSLDGAASVSLSVVKKGGYKTIEPRFLPEGIGYEEEGAVVPFVPSGTVAVIDPSDAGSLMLNNPLLYDLVVGKTYTVTHNGTPYELACNSAPLDETRNIYYLGNLALFGLLDTPDTGEPILLFNIANTAGTTLGCPGMKENDTVEITGRVVTVHTIPEKYLPVSGTPMKLYISQSTSITNGATVDVYKDEACTEKCTVEDAKEIEKGRSFVVCIYSTSWQNSFITCQPTAYSLLGEYWSGNNYTIGVVLTYIDSSPTAHKTHTLYLRFQ